MEKNTSKYLNKRKEILFAKSEEKISLNTKNLKENKQLLLNLGNN